MGERFGKLFGYAHSKLSAKAKHENRKLGVKGHFVEVDLYFFKYVKHSVK